MKERRVVITGMGVVSCVGNDVASFWDSVVNGKCGLAKVTRFDAAEMRTQIAGEVKDFDITKFISPKEAKRMDLFCQYASASTFMALDNAGLPRRFEDGGAVNPERVGALVGSGVGGIQTMVTQSRALDTRGPHKVSPFLIPEMIIDMAAGNISILCNAKGPNFGLTSACASGTNAIGEAAGIIARDDADIMIAGGAEGAVVPLCMAGFCAMKAMSERNDDPLHASRPFDRNRDGFVMAEGAGILILEELEHAQKRGANILAELVGYGATGDAFHITSPHSEGDGAARAMLMAMKHAQLNPEQIDYINAHGTSTSLNDKYETLAIKRAFGNAAKQVSVSSIKGTIGHALGAAGALESVACIQAIRDGVVPPTINYETPDPDCDLDITPNQAVSKPISTALNINLGFGGHNAVLIFKKF